MFCLQFSSSSLSLFQPGFYVNADLQKLVETFVIEYFKWYDGDDPEATRKNLMPAYDDQVLIYSILIYFIAIFRQYLRYRLNRLAPAVTMLDIPIRKQQRHSILIVRFFISALYSKSIDSIVIT